MYIFGWIVLGLALGVSAKLAMSRRDPGGLFITALLGIVGALVGGFLGRLVGWYGDGDLAGFALAVIGSIVLLGVYRWSTERAENV